MTIAALIIRAIILLITNPTEEKYHEKDSGRLRADLCCSAGRPPFGHDSNRSRAADPAMTMVLTPYAVQQGATAQILLCGPAGDIALQDAPETATAGQSPRDASP